MTLDRHKGILMSLLLLSQVAVCPSQILADGPTGEFPTVPSESKFKQGRTPEPRELKPGEPVEVELSAGGSHSYAVRLEPGQYLHVVVDQRGIDVVVRAFDPQGKLLSEANSPVGALGPEILSLVGGVAGAYRFEVSPVKKEAPGGRYEIRIAECRESRPEDSKRILAERTSFEANGLNSHHTKESLQKAIDRYQAALALWKDIDDRYQEALMLHGIGASYYLLQEYREALAYYDQALAVRRSIGDRHGAAITLNDSALIYDGLGQKQKALECYSESLELRRSVGDRQGEAVVLNNLGMVSSSMGNIQKALEYLGMALPLRRELEDREGEAVTLNNIGIAYDSLGEKQTALEYFEKSLSLRRAVGDNRGLVITLSNIGSVYLDLGEYQKALDRFVDVLAVHITSGDRQGQSSVHNNIGLVYRSLGDYAKALDHYSEALALSKAVGERNRVATVLSNMGATHAAMGEYDKALAKYNEALPLRRATEDKAGQANTLNNIGFIYETTGDHEKALDYYQQALILWRAVKDRSGEGATLNNLGEVYNSLKKSKEALDAFQQALAASRASANRRQQAQVLANIARVESAAGRLDEARSDFEQSLDLTELLRGSVLSQGLRGSYMASVRSRYESYIGLLMKLHDLRPGESFDALALQVSQRSRARSLLEMIAESRIDIRRDLSADQRAHEDKILNRISSIQKDLWNQNLTPERERQLRTDLASAEDELEGLRAELRRTSPRYARAQYPDLLTLKKIQGELLDPGTALLEYVLGDDQSFVWLVSRNKLSTRVLPPRKQIEPLIESYRQELAQKVSALTAAQSLARLEPQSRRLYDLLVGPLEGDLSTTRRLIIVPDGLLAHLPFETLISGNMTSADQTAMVPRPETQTSERGPRFLLERYDISYAPSASAIAAIRERAYESRPHDKDLIAFGDPVYDPGDSGGERLLARHQAAPSTQSQSNPSAQSQSAQAAPLDPEIRMADLYKERGFDFARLPNTRTEIAAISSLFPASRCRIFLGSAASEQQVKSEKLDQYRYIHFAAHGYLDEEHPSRSGIVMSFDKNSGEDGILQAHEIMGLRLNAELVTLSACQTGLGKVLSGEGVIGLSRAFLYAGASSVVVSLWNANDVATAELMKQFYRGLSRGRSKDEALRDAKLALIKGQQRSWRHPYYWAPFILMGRSH